MNLHQIQSEKLPKYTIDLLLQAQLLTVTPLTVTVGYSDTLEDSQTITNDFEVVTVTNMLLQ